MSALAQGGCARQPLLVGGVAQAMPSTLPTAGATPGLTSAAASAAPDGADAALICACQAFDALEDRIQAFYAGGATPIADDDNRDAAIAPLEAQQHRLLRRICAARAQTLQGINARARMILRWGPNLADDPGPAAPWDHRLLAALLRDFAPAGAHG